ncbi:uncharacterized protein BP5553_07821 [Venustampulla echinocandica]|uniref:Uncharacterized protein n=1 Tax=Venustampulla echinocandica TaxID=2656787 RepID=A0A370THL6_9HELO|nr:uncharacterized protein BP5553_07821 [Venustampulla echinocandica]RDL34693.1 hypothetical protein BP5553_07821 [Venustampulla echinocandica]
MADVPLLANVLAYTAGKWTRDKVDLLHVSASSAHPRLRRIANTEPESYFARKDGKWYKGEEKGDEIKVSDRREILQPFGAPDFLTNQMCTDLNGYFGSKSSFDNGEKLVELSTWFRCLVKKVLRSGEELTPDGKSYLWYEMGFFTRWRHHPHGCRVLCIDTPVELRLKLEEVLQVSPPPELRDPFAMLRPLFDQIIDLYDDSIWRVRDQVRFIEKNRLTPKTNFVNMHEIARHTGHVLEVEEAAIQTMKSLLRRQEMFDKTLPVALNKTYQEQAQEEWHFQIQAMNALKLRCLSNQERLSAEIALAFNMIASQDNMVMKSIALLTMTVLPATFVSVGAVQHNIFHLWRGTMAALQAVLDILGSCDPADHGGPLHVPGMAQVHQVFVVEAARSKEEGG